MSARLILMRHAKSVWDDPGLSDHDRPLTDRGRREARAIGGWLQAQGFVPDQVVCSTAARAAETWETLALMLAPRPAVQFSAVLYCASPDTMLWVLRRATGDTVMLIAHNPGIAMLAELLAGSVPGRSDFARYPSAATTVLTFADQSWSGVDYGHGTVEAFSVPRDLTG